MGWINNSMLKEIGCIFIVIGTIVGGGMLALPIVSGPLGFFPSIIILSLVWFVMLITGWQIVEINVCFPVYRNSFATMAHVTCGRVIKYLSSLFFLLLLYSLLAAYISGAASLFGLLSSVTWHSSINYSFACVIFVLIMGSIIWYGTRTVDIINRFLIVIKFILLFAVLFSLTPKINLASIYISHFSKNNIMLAIPIFITAFGYQHVIPSLTNYIGKDRVKLKRILFFGTIVPLLVYIFWMLDVIGIISFTGKESFSTIHFHQHNQVAFFIATLLTYMHGTILPRLINVFSNIAVLTSFLGVGLGLFDLVADLYKRENTLLGRLQTACITFIPALLLALYFSSGFMQLLAYGAVFIAVLEILLPALMVFRMRRLQLAADYKQSFVGNIFVLLTFSIMAMAIIIITIFFH